MVAYWVARAKVNDPAQYKKYADLAPAIIGKFGGKFLARGGKFKILEGPEKFHRFVVIEFPSFEKAVACHESPEYLEPPRTARRTAQANWRSSSSNASETHRQAWAADQCPPWVEQTFCDARAMSALHPKATSNASVWNVR